MSTVQEYYQQECVPQLIEQFGYKNVMEVPKLGKIVLNMGLGEGMPSTRPEATLMETTGRSGFW